ncbi:50S ribosomal protein L11 methyltransferase [bacterium]|nr:50S ribosomal protein L11 methyltransferase [bacterium]
MTDIVFIRARFSRSTRDEELQAMLIAREPLGFLEDDDWWEVYFREEDWQEISEELLNSFNDEEKAIAPEISRMKQENWNKQWEESIRPISITDHIIITPSWHEVEAKADELVLVIDPKMSFGTGYHESTRLMLRLIERYLKENDNVLDVGTGTGVLAIAAIRLGAAKAVGVDIDEWSYDNAMENAERNDVQQHIRFHHGSLEEAEGRYDLILSNITRIDNMQLLPRYAEMLRGGGRLLLAGFYESDVADLRLAIEHVGLVVDEVLLEGEWASIAARREA